MHKGIGLLCVKIDNVDNSGLPLNIEAVSVYVIKLNVAQLCQLSSFITGVSKHTLLAYTFLSCSDSFEVYW